MNNPYFTLASLPTLDPGAPAPFADMSAFWTYVDHVPAEWRAQFEGGTATDPTVKAYREWDLALRVELARLRLENLPWKDQLAALPDQSTLGDDRALEALDRATPLEAEMVLDTLRWSFLDELGQDHQFDRVSFFVYVLKLELVQRKSALVREKGQEVFDGLHAKFLAQADLTIPTGDKS